MASVVNTGFDPLFGDPARRLIDQARAMGYEARFGSGVRSSEDQRQLYANMLAGRAGRPLPYPERGPVRQAAVPGSSLHERGLAGDIYGVPQDVLARLASRLGLQTLASDPNHIQLANWRQAEATQGPPTPWGTPPSRYAGPDVPSSGAIPVSATTANPDGGFVLPGGAAQPARVGTATPIPGGTSHADFIRAYAQSIGLDPNLALGIANAEGLRAWSAQNPNAASTVDVRNGQPFSFGDFQLNIHPGAVGAQALAAKIDPRDPNQWQAADKFALDYMKAHGVGAWSGDPVAKQYLASGKVPALAAMPGTTLYSAPTTAAGGSSAASGAGQPAQGPIGSADNLPGFTPNSPAAKQTAAGLKTLGLGGGQDDKPPDIQPSPMIGAPPQAMGGAMMASPGYVNATPRTIAQNQLGQQGFQMSPSLAYAMQPPFRPLGSPPPGSQIMPGAATGFGGLPGTTLNSPSALQTAMMYGSFDPNDPYGRGGAQGSFDPYAQAFGSA